MQVWDIVLPISVRTLALNQVCHIDRHLLNSGVVELLDVMQCTLVFLGDEIDSDTFPSEPSSTANTIRFKQKQLFDEMHTTEVAKLPMNIIFTVGR